MVLSSATNPIIGKDFYTKMDAWITQCQDRNVGVVLTGNHLLAGALWNCNLVKSGDVIPRPRIKKQCQTKMIKPKE